MSDLVSDPAIAPAYEDVRNDKSDTNWLCLKYASGGADKITLAGTGTGGIGEFVATLGDDEAAFGYVRFSVGNDELSKRAKFVFVSWCGPAVKVMRKAKMTVQIGEVKQVLKAYAVEIQTDHVDELSAERVEMLLRKAMGANCIDAGVLRRV